LHTQNPPARRTPDGTALPAVSDVPRLVVEIERNGRVVGARCG